jgi:hypothetical protein
MSLLYSGVGVLGLVRMLHRVGSSFVAAKVVREMEGRIRIRARVLLKSLSFPSRDKRI